MTVNVKKLCGNARLPFRATSGSAGADLFAVIEGKEKIISPGETFLVPTGIALEIPEGFGGFIFARSSLASKYGVALANSVGVIDSDYRGEIKIPLINLGNEAFSLKNGDRIAQLVILPIEICSFAFTGHIPHSPRGEGGFGSTGNN